LLYSIRYTTHYNNEILFCQILFFTEMLIYGCIGYNYLGRKSFNRTNLGIETKSALLSFLLPAQNFVRFPMAFYAGVDWSGSPDAPETGGALEFYVPCGVRVASMDAINEQFTVWRDEFGFACNYEFHGYKLRRNPKVLVEATRYVLENAQVVAYLFEKYRLVEDRGPQVFEKPIRLAPATGLLVCHKMLESGPLRQVILDEDIAASHRPGFNTEVKRTARTRWPEQSLSKGFPKHQPSDKYNLIQLPDMIAYVLQREAHGLSETAELGRLVRALWNKKGNFIVMGGGDDLQPYL
jgi:hypothetical protein